MTLILLHHRTHTQVSHNTIKINLRLITTVEFVFIKATVFEFNTKTYQKKSIKNTITLGLFKAIAVIFLLYDLY